MDGMIRHAMRCYVILLRAHTDRPRHTACTSCLQCLTNQSDEPLSFRRALYYHRYPLPVFAFVSTLLFISRWILLSAWFRNWIQNRNCPSFKRRPPNVTYPHFSTCSFPLFTYLIPLFHMFQFLFSYIFVREQLSSSWTDLLRYHLIFHLLSFLSSTLNLKKHVCKILQ